jgi:hypothetical protein
MARTANQKRIYFVSIAGSQSMVRASSKARAITHALRGLVAEVAGQEQIVGWLSDGGLIEDDVEIDLKAQADQA